MPALAINQLISIPPEELECPTLNGKRIKIPIPNSHIGKKPIRVRLLSAKRRIGMVSVQFLNVNMQVKGIIISKSTLYLIEYSLIL